MVIPLRLGGLTVVENNQLPRTIIGHWIYPAHPFVFWLARFLKFSPWTVVPMYDDPVFLDQSTGTLYMSSWMFGLLKKERSVIDWGCMS